MFKKLFFLGIAAGLLASLACIIYTQFYFDIIVDFSEKASVTKILSSCMMMTMGGCFVYFGLSKVIKKERLAEFIFNFLFTLVSIALVLYMLTTKDPVFKDEEINFMAMFYKGFVMPMLFFPALAWMTLKPLFFKS